MGDEIMRMLENLVLKEARTFERLKKQYKAMLAELPKGSLTLKRGVYYYLNYKEHGKMISKYVGKKSPEIDSLREKIKNRLSAFQRKYQSEEEAVALSVYMN